MATIKLDHIAIAAAEQKSAVETIARIVESVAADTEETNTALAEVDDTGVQLSRQAQDLLGQLTRFRISESGGSLAATDYRRT